MSPKLSALLSPACEQCGLPTRFVGLEAVVNSDHSDLCTYSCDGCGQVQTAVFARSIDLTGEALTTASN
jgi:MinD superfamily P-loop ATPase